jgi:hypothetical protein
MGLALDHDIRLLCDMARSINDLGIIVIDPISNYLGKMKMNDEGDVRSILKPLVVLADELQVEILTVGHVNKSDSKDARERMMGAAAFVGVARSVFAFGKDDEVLDTEKAKYSHIMTPVRGEMCDAFKYHTEVVEKEYTGGVKSKIVRVVWDGRSKANSEAAMTHTSQKDNSATKEAAEMIRGFLRGGKQTASKCIAFMEQGGIEVKKLNTTRICKLAGVEKDQRDGAWYWFLPTSAGLFEPPAAREDSRVPKF